MSCGAWSLRQGAVPLLAAGLLLAGCNAPNVSLKPPTWQHSATHIADGDRAATRIAESLTQSGLLPGLPGQAAPVPQRNFYIHVASDGSTFLHVLKPALEGEIMRRGGSISRSAAQAMVVNLEVDVVAWGPRLPRGNGAGTLAGAGFGLGVVLEDAAPLQLLDGALVGVGLGLAVDLLDATAPRHGAEIAWRASIYEGDRLAFHAREPMYIHEADIPLFLGRGRLAPIASATQAPLPVRQIRYVP